MSTRRHDPRQGSPVMSFPVLSSLTAPLSMVISRPVMLLPVHDDDLTNITHPMVTSFPMSTTG